MSKDLCGKLILKADTVDIYLLKFVNRNTTTKASLAIDVVLVSLLLTLNIFHTLL